MNKLLKSTLFAAALSLPFLINGCANNPGNTANPPSASTYSIADPDSASIDITNRYFSRIPMAGASAIAGVSGDFDSDGDLDFIVGAESNKDDFVHLYFYKNTGNYLIGSQNIAFSKPIEIAKVKETNRSTPTIIAGDYDNNGTIDLVVGVENKKEMFGELYFLKNDGNANFVVMNIPNR